MDWLRVGTKKEKFLVKLGFLQEDTKISEIRLGYSLSSLRNLIIVPNVDVNACSQ